MGEFHKEWTEAGVSASGANKAQSLAKELQLSQSYPESETVSKETYVLRRKRTGLLLRGTKSSF